MTWDDCSNELEFLPCTNFGLCWGGWYEDHECELCSLSLSLSQITARLARPSRADDERAWESFAVCTLLSRKASNALRRRDTCGGTAPPPTPESRYACIWTPCALGACCLWVSQLARKTERQTTQNPSTHELPSFCGISNPDYKSRIMLPTGVKEKTQKSAGL
jgi:hypothetical protein